MDKFKQLIDDSVNAFGIVIGSEIVFANKKFRESFIDNENINLDKALINIMTKHVCDSEIVVNGKILTYKFYTDTIIWDNKNAVKILAVDVSDTLALENYKLISLVAENVSLGLWQIDFAGGLVYANSYFCQIFEQELQNLIDHQFYNFFHGAEDIKQQCLGAVETASKFQCELILDDGIIKWIEISSKPLPNGLGAVGTIEDITKDKLYLPELIKIRDELKRERVR